jgi:hypothetical protein
VIANLSALLLGAFLVALGIAWAFGPSRLIAKLATGLRWHGAAP